MTTAETAPFDEVAANPLAWRMLALVGVAFVVIGLVIEVTVLFPLRVGNPEWEFGTVNAFLDSLPLLVIGLSLLAAFGVARGHPWLARAAGAMFIILALIVLAGALLYATVVPQALNLRNYSRIEMLTAVKKAITKAAFQSAVYPIGFLWVGIAAFRFSSRRRAAL